MAKILIVDDETVYHGILERILSGDGHEFAFAAGFEEARELLGFERFDLMITDNHMPGGSGIDLLELMREEGLGTAVIVMSGLPDKDMIERADKLGATAFLVKPFPMSQFRAIVDEALRGPDAAGLEADALMLAEEDSEWGSPSLLEEGADDGGPALDPAFEQRVEMSAPVRPERKR